MYVCQACTCIFTYLLVYECGDALFPCLCGLDRHDSSKGYTVENAQPCCPPCNSSKSDLDPHEFMVRHYTKHVPNFWQCMRDLARNKWLAELSIAVRSVSSQIS